MIVIRSIHLSLITLLLIAGPCTHAEAQKQERQYLDAFMEATTKKNAVYYRVLTGSGPDGHIARTYQLDGKMKAEGVYADEDLTVENGSFTYYHGNGKVESRGKFEMGLKKGIWERYDKWGRPLAEKVYDPGYLEGILYTRAQTMPAYANGGEQGLARYVRSRLAASTGKKMKGRLTANVIVEKDGTVSSVKMLESLGPDMTDQVVEAIRTSGPWSPGVERGQPVRVQMKVPVEL